MSERIEATLSQTNVNNTKEVRKPFLLGFARVTFLVPDDMTLVVEHIVTEDSSTSYDSIYVGPVREDNQAAVEGLKTLVDRALE